MMRQDAGHLADHIVAFARALRAAGLPVGPGTVIDALNALRHIALDNRDDVFTALQSVFVMRHEQAAVFKQALHQG
jgi:uncharacterized protein